MKSLVNIIIVNWNGKYLLSDCLEGLRSQAFKSFCITMVDNGSSDGSVEYVEKNYPEVEIIKLAENTGFAAGNNVAIKKAKTKYIALLNNDTKAHPLWLKELVNAMEMNSEIGFAASKMVYFDSPEIIDRAGDVYTTAGTGLLRGRSKSSKYFNQEELVFGACAGAAIYRTEMLNEIGLFDEKYFLLYEDVDLSFRAQLQGYKCLYVPGAIVYHKVGSSIGHDSSTSIYYSHRNLEWTYLKCMPALLICRTVFQHIIYSLGSFIYFTATGKSGIFIKAKWHALKGLKGVLKKRRAVQNKRRVDNEYIWELLKNETFYHRINRRFRAKKDKKITNILIDFTQIPKQKVGVGIYSLNLIKEIAGLSSNNKYFILVQDDDPCLDFMASNHLELIRVKSKYYRFVIFRIILEQLIIPYIILKKRIGVVHSLHYSVPLISFNAKKVVTIHDMTFFKFPRLHKKLKTIYFKLFINLLPKTADKVISISKSTCNDFISLTGADKDKITVIYSGIPELKFPQFPDKKISSIKKNFGITGEYLLFIGMIEPRKNLHTLILAFDKFIQQKSSYQLVIAGPKGWHYDSIFKAVEDLGLQDKIIFTGYVSDEEKTILLKNAKIFVYPSIYEGFGLPVLEALSMGTATVTSNISSMPEVVEDAAVMINPESSDELSLALKMLVDDQKIYREIKRKAVLQAAKFSWKIAAEKTIEVYESALTQDQG